MKKKPALLLLSAFTLVFSACTDRDRNGVTDANNTKTGKKYTDSTSVQRITKDSTNADSFRAR